MARNSGIEISLPKALQRGAFRSPNGHKRPLQMADAVALSVKRVLEVFDEEPTAVRLFLPDGIGRLRQAASGGMATGVGRKRSERRRTAFECGVPVTMVPRSLPGYRLAILPLSSRGRRVGILEVLARAGRIEEREAALAKAAGDAAQIVGQARDRLELRADLSFPAAALVREMVRASSPSGAVRALVRFYFERFGIPVAGWLAEGAGKDAELISVRGVGTRKRNALRQEMGSFRRWDRLPVEDREFYQEKFAKIMDCSDVAVLHVSDSVMLAGGSGPALERSMGVLGPLLGDVFAHLATVNWAERRNQGLDMGIALTAHEVRGPLLGARAVIDHVLSTTNGDAEHRRMLESSILELERLAELVDSLLRWSVGSAAVRRRRTDLIAVTREAVRSSALEMGEDRVDFSAMEPSVVKADPAHLRVAIRNLVRNALAYSSPDTEVKVRVNGKGQRVTVSVANRGPGIPAGEEEAIFDPFVRGEAALQTGARGSGLGLFITRKIAEAHGGEVWVDSSPRGTTFFLQLPAANGTCKEPSPES